MDILDDCFIFLKKVLLDFFKTSRTIEDANKIIEENLKNPYFINLELLELLRFMIADNSNYPKELISVSREITINILKNNFEIIKEKKILEKFLLEKEKYYRMSLSSNVISNNNADIIKLENYWATIYNDMENHNEYDEPMKILLLIREDMNHKIIKNKKENNSYSLETLYDYFDLEFIGEGLYYKRYKFYGLFDYICNFVYDTIGVEFKSVFLSVKNKYLRELQEKGVLLDDNSNRTTLELIKFISLNYFLFVNL